MDNYFKLHVLVGTPLTKFKMVKDEKITAEELEGIFDSLSSDLGVEIDGVNEESIVYLIARHPNLSRALAQKILNCEPKFLGYQLLQNPVCPADIITQVLTEAIEVLSAYDLKRSGNLVAIRQLEGIVGHRVLTPEQLAIVQRHWQAVEESSPQFWRHHENFYRREDLLVKIWPHKQRS